MKHTASLLAFVVSIPLMAQPSVPDRFTLKTFWTWAEKNGAQLNESQGKLAYSEAREGLADSFAYPSGKLDVFAGLAPQASGDALSGQNDWSSLTVARGLKIEITQPVYTFGALASGRRAARAGTEAQKALNEKDRWALRTEVAEFYYQYQLAFELSELLEGIVEKLSEALNTGEKMRAKNRSGAPSASDLDRLKVYLSDLKVKQAEAQKSLQQLKAAMAWKIGLLGVVEPKWDRANLKAVVAEVPDLKSVQDQAFSKRPDFVALQKNVEAKNALAGVEEGQLLPTLFVAGQMTYSVAPGRADQSSPFAYDPLNDLSGAAFVGVRWNLGFFERNARLHMARAETIMAESQLKHLSAAIRVDVEKNFRDFTFARDTQDLRKDGSTAARHVYTDQFLGWGLGNGKAQSLIEAIGAFGLAEKARFESLYGYNLSLVKLEAACGHEYGRYE